MYRSLLILLSLALLPASADAKPRPPAIQHTGDHARDAFMFADKGRWKDAVSHARLSGNPVLAKLITWQYLLDSDSGASFQDIVKFIHANPDWPEQKRLRLRAEFALKNSNASDSDIIGWFKDDAPLTGVGKIALAEALSHEPAEHERVITLIRDAWKNGDFDERQEQALLETYEKDLRREDHEARLERLLWEEKTNPAVRMLPLVSDSKRAQYEARMALIGNDRDAAELVGNLSSSERSETGVLYERIRWRARQGDHAGVQELLLDAPDQVPYPEKWWKYREMEVREAIGEKEYSTARKLLAAHGQVEGQELSNANWLNGWLHLQFLNQPEDAYSSFSSMYDTVKYPVSRSRAAYWAARAAEKMGQKQSADEWYTSASQYPTTFYGQLALAKRNISKLQLPSAPSIDSAKRQSFEKDELTRAAKLSAEYGERDLAGKILNFIIERSDDPAKAAMAAELGGKIGHNFLAVRGAKKAAQQNIILIESGYPRIKTPHLALERNLALAITRQESEFDPKAKSSAGAMGMMQLLPKTAREVARRSGIGYKAARLTEPEYNMMLGSEYLDRMIERNDGSYILGIASYNAGPGNVRKWVEEYGAPEKNLEAFIDWIEKIPFSETRNYVQRVLENLQVYRHLDDNNAKLEIDKDILR